MSFDSASSGSLASHPLTVDIPAQYPLESNSSSVNSSLSSSPTATGGMTIPSPSPKGILDIRNRSASLPSSTTSLPTTAMNVKFAPLPELAPRRRRSTAPLGVAARSQLMRRRRGMHGEDPPPVPSGNGMWTETELEDHARRRFASEEQDRRDQEDFEDPFLALGRMMKGAWKKMSNSSGSNRAKTSKAVVVSGMTDSMPQQEPRTSNLIVREDSEAEQGGVWEEEIGHAIPRNIGQTETIREVERQQKDSRSSSS